MSIDPLLTFFSNMFLTLSVNLITSCLLDHLQSYFIILTIKQMKISGKNGLKQFVEF